MLKQNRSLKSAISSKSLEKTIEVLSSSYSSTDIISSLAEMLIQGVKPSVSVVPSRLKISREDFERYFEIHEKRPYKKRESVKQSVPAVSKKAK